MTRSERDPTRARLADVMDDRRRRLRLTWEQVAHQAGIHRETLRQIRAGAGSIRPLSAAGLEDALRWEHGSIDAVLAGGEPTPVADRHVELYDSADAEDELTLSEKVDQALTRLEELTAEVKELREQNRRIS